MAQVHKLKRYRMLVKFPIISCMSGLLIPLFLCGACQQKDTDLDEDVLIRVANRVMTVHDFNNAFEIAKIAYDSHIGEQPQDLKKAQLRLLNDLTVEMILLERADELDINITENELRKAVSAIKGDYPEGEFEKTLLEYAVSYDSWKGRLRNRLIMEKVIDVELKSRITITSEEISEYYQKNFQDKEEKSGLRRKTADINETIAKQLRRQKTEETYNIWIEDLKGQYEIEINSNQWDKITSSARIKNSDKRVYDVSKKD